MSLRTAWAVAAAVLLHASRAAAGPVELLDRLLVAPGDPRTLVLTYRNGGGGLLVSHDGGKHFRFRCNTAIDGDFRREASASLVRADGSILLGVFDGLWRGDRDACGFSRDAAFEGQWVNDFAVDPRDPTRAFAITSAGGKPNGTFRNDGTSAAWTAVGPQEDILINRVLVAAHGVSGLRIYQSAVRGVYELAAADGGIADTLPRYVIRYSDDLGERWTEHPFGRTDGTLRLLAVDPTSVERIVVAVLRDQLDGVVSKPDDVLWSAAAGAPGSFEKLGEVTELGDLDFAPNGRIFYGDRDQTTPGLYAVAKLGAAPKRIDDQSKVQCVRYDAQTDTLYVCHDRNLGTVDPTTGEFFELFDLAETESWIDCQGEPDPAPRCEAQLLAAFCGVTHYPMTPICEDYQVPGVDFSAADGGVAASAGGADAGSKSKAPNAGSCAVSLRAQVAPSRLAVSFLLVLAWAAAIRRRRR